MATIKNQVIPQITGYGLKGFEDNLGYFEKNFFDNVEKFSVFDKKIDFISETAAAYFQEEKFKKVYSKQMTELSWFEKNIYINSEKEKRLLDERTKDAQVKGLLVDLAIWGAGKLLKYGSAYIANENEKKRLAKSSYQILAYISGNKGEIPESAQTILSRVLEDLPVSNSKKKDILLNTDFPKRILDIESCNSVREFRTFIGSNAYKILQKQNFSDKRILQEKRPVFELIGFESTKELKSLLSLLKTIILN